MRTPGTTSAPANRVDPANALAITGATGMFNGHAITLGPAATGSTPSAYEYVPASLTKLLDASADPAVTIDKLFYVGGSPLTCRWYHPDGTTDWKYPFAGGFLDPYGVRMAARRRRARPAHLAAIDRNEAGNAARVMAWRNPRRAAKAGRSERYDRSRSAEPIE